MSKVNGRTEPRLVEVTSVPVVYSDGVAKVLVEGGNVRITFFEYRTIAGERVKMPILEMVRPVESCRGHLPALIATAIGDHNGPASDRKH